jgi:hypothetical protein
MWINHLSKIVPNIVYLLKILKMDLTNRAVGIAASLAVEKFMRLNLKKQGQIVAGVCVIGLILGIHQAVKNKNMAGVFG